MDRERPTKADIQYIIDDVTTAIENAILHGVEVKNAPSLAAMVKALKTLKGFSETYLESSDASWFVNRIEGELSAVKNYHDEWAKTGNDLFRQIARDEARHARQLRHFGLGLLPGGAGCRRRR